MNGAAIRTGLTALLATVDGLKVYGSLPSKPELPAAAIGTSDPFIEYHETYSPQFLTFVNFEVLVVVTRGNGDERAAAELDGFVFESIPDALYSDKTVSGALYAGTSTAAAQSLLVRSASSYSPVQWNDLDLLGCRLAVVVNARHT